MKKLILVFTAIAITAGAYAQIDSTNTKMSPQDLNKNQNQKVQNTPVDKSCPDGVMMKNGKILEMKNGQSTILDHDMTMSDGTKIMSDGSFINNDGTKMMMKEGQHMDMSGNMILKTNDDKNMYLVPDSTTKNDK